MNNTRRSLLKVSAGAPIVLTVRPASALAASSLSTCAMADAQRSASEILSASTDEWLRAEVALYPTITPSMGGTAILPSSGFQYWFKNAYKNTGQWWELAMNAGQPFNDQVNTKNYLVTSYAGTGTPVTGYALVLVDKATWQPIAYKWETTLTASQQITCSCWASIS